MNNQFEKLLRASKLHISNERTPLQGLFTTKHGKSVLLYGAKKKKVCSAIAAMVQIADASMINDAESFIVLILVWLIDEASLPAKPVSQQEWKVKATGIHISKQKPLVCYQAEASNKLALPRGNRR